MKRRFTDLDDQATLAERSGDFVRRELKPGTTGIFLSVMLIASIMVAIHLIVEDIHFFAIYTGMLFASLFLIMNRMFGGINNVVFTNDFENSIFAGAAGTGYEFLLIIKNNNEVVYYNPACKEYFIYQPQSLRQPIESLLESVGLSRSDRTKIHEAIKENLSTEIRCTLQNVLQEKKHLILTLSPISRPKGFFVIKAKQDPTRIHTPTIANTPFSESLSIVWEHFLNHSPLALVTFNNNHIITRYNAAFYLMCDPSTLKGEELHLIDVMAKQSKETVSKLLNHVRENETPVMRPIDVKLAGAESKSASLYITSINNTEEGDNYVAYLIDTTEQKNLEQRFVHSQKMQAVGQLAGGVAHDFNNLLTAMIGFCDLLLAKHPPGDPSFADIMQIKQNANRAANLVRQLLAFSRKQTLQPDVIDLTEIISELSNLIRRLIGENIVLNINHSRDLHHVKVDKGQFEQVIINLAVNARDAINAGDPTKGGQISIATSNVVVNAKNPIDSRLLTSPESETLAEGEYVVIEVNDNGHGMSKDVQKQIFEPFFTTKRVGEGTGLGLSTAYGIIQQTGGHIFVKSGKDAGTSFYIYLKKFDEPQKKIAEDGKPQMGDLTGTGKILLVEDEIPVRTFSSRALQNKGYNVREADSAEAGLEIIHEEKGNIDVIITDVVMPGMTGPAMVEEIHKTYPNIKVIFISGYGEDAFITSYGSQRSFNFLPKPFTLNQLAQKVKDVMK